MSGMLVGQEAQNILEQAVSGCRSCNHVPEETLDRIEKGRAVAAWNNEGWGPEHSCNVLVELPDGTWATIDESEDSSGHGCQCDGNVNFFSAREEAERLGLNTSDREDLARAK